MQSVAQAKTPAWPTLLGVQVLVVLALGATAWKAHRTARVDHPAVERRLAELNVLSATAALDQALGQVENAAALTASDVLRVTSFLSLAGQGAGLSVKDVRIETVAVNPQVPGAQPVEAVIDVSGDVYDLPIFLEGTHRQRVRGTLQSLAFDVAPGGAMHGQVRIRYLRALTPDVAWIGERLSVAAPGAVMATRVLERAAELQSWRVFNAGDAERRQDAIQAREQAARELPPNLVILRESGGRFLWDVDAGMTIR